jgi:hypothetical protein
MRGYYGCKRDDATKTPADHKFALSWNAPKSSIVLPPTIDLSASLPPLPYQGPNSTCVVHAATAAMRFDYLSQGQPDIELSRLFPYYYAGIEENDTTDDGRQIRDVVQQLQLRGTCRESLWQYDASLIAAPPSLQAQSDAASFKVTDCQRVNCDQQSIYTSLFVGKPVILGLEIFKQFESDECAETGIVQMPGLLDSSVGLHAMLAWGCGINGGFDAGANWWTPPEGPVWGYKGSALFPQGYWGKFGSDLWVLNTATEAFNG